MDNPIWAVVPAAGTGQRFSPDEDKLLADLDGKPVLYRTIDALLNARSIAGIVIATSPERQDVYHTILSGIQTLKPVRWAVGGDTRRDSVIAGVLKVKELAPDHAEWVAIHDAARPLILPGTVDEAVKLAETQQCGVFVGIPVVDTVKQVDDSDPLCPAVQSTVDRRRLWRAQTPQVAPVEALLQANGQVPYQTPVTDDVQLLELTGLAPVRCVPGRPDNLKITVQEDLLLARWYWQNRQ